MTSPHNDDPAVALPASPVMVVGYRNAALLQPSGEVETLDRAAAARRLDGIDPPIVCHAPETARRLGRERMPAFDVLELYAFVRPATFCVPTPRGLALALGLAPPTTLESAAVALADAARRLLVELADGETPGGGDVAGLAVLLNRSGWPWGRSVLSALGLATDRPVPAGALAVWRDLPAWAEHAPEPPPANQPVHGHEARARLAELLGSDSEARPQQTDYAVAVSAAFEPRASEGAPHMVLAEAGTGVGKTVGYLAPASVWAEKNQGTVWISTFTRNLQRQLDGEIDRLYPDAEEKARKAVIRKGRENYLCLLNMEEATGGGMPLATDAVALALMARWARHSRDGDMMGGDFPAWLAGLVGRGRTLGLADRRGECIYSACAHYHKCYVERSIRRARRADIVIANHALVMIQAALGGGEDARLPQRYVFDEGHHVFGAADGAFSAHLTGLEMAELRRWIRGAEGRRSRARGLRRRIEDLLIDDPAAGTALAAAEKAAAALPGDGWLARQAESHAGGPAEALLALAQQQVRARSDPQATAYDLETEVDPPVEGMVAAAAALDRALAALELPMLTLEGRLAARLDDDAGELDSAARQRIEAVCRGLRRRGGAMLEAWRAMLQTIGRQTPAEFVDWFALDRRDGRTIDIGLHRHWLDPTRPFAETVAAPAHGLLITSATLTDGTGDAEVDWKAAEARTGARHLPRAARRVAVLSPFDYAAQTRVLVVTDVRKSDLTQVAAAYRTLFVAAGGGALGLFTAISRLRAVHDRIAEPLEAAGLNLLAQHVSGLDVATLIDIFRGEEDACLLGTDAVRDGVDVPGRSLRLIVFDRVPWPRPDILHRARRAAFGGRDYDDTITRLRLKQAFGRLIRRADDKGVFVLLDGGAPSRLMTGFPDGVRPERLGIADAAAAVRNFLADGGDPA